MWRDIIAIVGTVASLAGLYVAWLAAKQAGTAAEAATAAKNAIKQQTANFDAAKELSAALELMERLLELLGLQEWVKAARLCASARKHLVEGKDLLPERGWSAVVQSAVVSMREIEVASEQAGRGLVDELAAGAQSMVVLTRIDEVREVLAKLRRHVGE